MYIHKYYNCAQYARTCVYHKS